MASEQLFALLAGHLGRTPAMGVPDVYKVLHQGVFGQGHPVPNRKAAREWLEQEANLVDPGLTVPLLESVHPETALVRVNVRPFVTLGGKLPALLDAYVRSGELIHGDESTLAGWWDTFCEMISTGALRNRFVLRDALLLKKVRQSDHWAAVHHTPGYIQHYKPVYRVVTAELAETLCRDQRLPFEIV